MEQVQSRMKRTCAHLHTCRHANLHKGSQTCTCRHTHGQKQNILISRYLYRAVNVRLHVCSTVYLSRSIYILICTNGCMDVYGYGYVYVLCMCICITAAGLKVWLEASGKRQRGMPLGGGPRTCAITSTSVLVCTYTYIYIYLRADAAAADPAKGGGSVAEVSLRSRLWCRKHRA